MSLMANMVASFLMFLVSANGQRGYCDKDFVISSWPTWLHRLMFLVSADGLMCLSPPPQPFLLRAARREQLPSRASGELATPATAA